MNKLLIILILVFSLSASVRADEADEMFCDKSRACKKVCKLKRQDEYNDLDEGHRELMLKCMNDLAIKLQ